jgi:hypothetical protein
MKTKVLEDEVMLLKAKEEEFIAEKKRVEKMNEEIKVLKEQLLEKEQKQVSEEKKKKNVSVFQFSNFFPFFHNSTIKIKNSHVTWQCFFF